MKIQLEEGHQKLTIYGVFDRRFGAQQVFEAALILGLGLTISLIHGNEDIRVQGIIITMLFLLIPVGLLCAQRRHVIRIDKQARTISLDSYSILGITKKTQERPWDELIEMVVVTDFSNAFIGAGFFDQSAELSFYFKGWDLIRFRTYRPEHDAPKSNFVTIHRIYTADYTNEFQDEVAPHIAKLLGVKLGTPERIPGTLRRTSKWRKE